MCLEYSPINGAMLFVSKHDFIYFYRVPYCQAIEDVLDVAFSNNEATQQLGFFEERRRHDYDFISIFQVLIIVKVVVLYYRVVLQ